MSRRRALPPPKNSLFAQPVPSATTAAKRTTISLTAAVVDRLRDAAHVEGFGVGATVEDLITGYVDRLEDDRGEPFPPRPRR